MGNARAAGRGGAAIFFSNILSTVISAVGVIIVIRLLSPSDYGLYTIASIPSSLILLFGDWGMTSALMKFTAQYRAEGKKQKVASILHYGLIFQVGLTAVLTFVTFFISDFVAGFVLQKPEAALLIKVSSLMVFGNQLYDTSWAIFLGFETMRYNMIMQVLFSVSKTGLSILLAFLGLKAFGAMVGFSSGYLAAGAFGILIVFFVLYSPLKRTSSEGSMSFTEVLSMTLRFGFPLAITTIISGFGGQIYSFLMARYSSTLSIGNYGVASTFTVLVSFITFPVANLLFPTFSKMSGAETREGLETAFRTSIKYVSFLLLPITVGVMVLSQPLVGVLFGEAYGLAPLFLVLMSVGSLFCGLGSLSMNSILSSQGETKTILKIGLLSLAFGIPLSLILIPYFGVIGFLASSLVVQLIATLLAIYWVKKIFNFKMWTSQSVMTYVAAFTMGALVWATLSVLRLFVGVNSEGALLGIGFLVGLVSYFFLLPLIGGIQSKDLENINAIFGNFGLLDPIFKIFYISMRRVIAVCAHKKS